jgi:hypothetical protein
VLLVDALVFSITCRSFLTYEMRGSLRVPSPGGQGDAHRPAPAEGDQLELFDAPATTTKRGYRHRWSWLLAHTFRADLEHCPRCGGPMRWAEVATGEAVLPLLIEHGLAPRAPPPVCPVPLGQLELPYAG